MRSELSCIQRNCTVLLDVLDHPTRCLILIQFEVIDFAINTSLSALIEDSSFSVWQCRSAIHSKTNIVFEVNRSRSIDTHWYLRPVTPARSMNNQKRDMMYDATANFTYFLIFSSSFTSWRTVLAQWGIFLVIVLIESLYSKWHS
jgi:hypothetical protein